MKIAILQELTGEKTMKQFGICGFAAAAVTCILLFAAGCSGPSGKPAVDTQPDQPAELALKFVPADTTTYKVVLEAGKSVRWFVSYILIYSASRI